MRRLILVLLLLIPFLNWGQPYSIDWDGSTNVSPWEEVKQTFNVTTQLPCQGTHSPRTRVRGIEGFSTSVLKSPLLFTATGGVITFSFDYKWLVYNSNMNSPVAGPANQIDARWQWSNSTSGPWYTFETIDNISHSPSTNCTTKTATFAPKAGKLYVRLIVSNTSAAGDNYFYLDNISIDQGTPPTCFMPDDLYITDKTDTGFTLNWSSTNTTLMNYEFEVRTSGAPGSGTAGLVTTAPPAGPVGTATSVTITGLNASTNYKVYVRTNCDATDSSFWIGIDVTTMCTPPTFTIPDYNICGRQRLEMEVTGSGTSFWYDANDSLVAQATNKYVIDPVTKSETFKIYHGIFNGLVDIIQAGAGVTSATNATPFAAEKSQKIQYIYLAEELTAAGFSRGVIKAFGFKVGANGGTLQRNNFTIHMGETSLEEFPDYNEFIPTNRLKEVKGLGNQLLISNDVNMFKLDTPFMWDGVSNIVVQITYSDLTATTVPTATTNILSSFGTSNRTLYVNNSVDDMTTIKDKVTGTRLIYRTNGYFEVIEGCFDQPKTVNVNFKEAPTLVLSDSIINNCANQPLPKVYVLSGVSDFDTYEWTIEPVDPNDPNDPANDPTHPNHPDNAVAGDENVGWTFNPVSPMTYYLTAKQSNTFPGGEACVNYWEVKVELPASPTMLQLQNDYSLCFDDIQELKVDNFVNEIPNEYLFNGNTTGVTLNNTITGDAITNDTTLFSEGTGSLKLSYGAQTNATLDFSPSINMNNLKSIVVEFDHIAALQSTATGVMDYGYLEYTTDNGTTWKPFLEDDYTGLADTTLTQPSGTQAMFFTATSYADWNGIQQTTVPTTTPWKTEKFVVPADEFTGTGTFKVRFRIGADGNTQFPGWYIDNVKIKPISNYQVTWTPIANLYYDQNATIPYDGTINTGTVYLKGTSNSLNVPYNVVIENQYGCRTEKNFTVSIGLKEAPVVNNIDTCEPVIDVSTINFGKNQNGVLTYYNSQTSTTPITQITSSGVYYVEQEISKCKSARVPFTVVISPAAPNAVATPTQNFCGSATVNDIAFNAVQGFQMKWYLTATGGTALASTAPINNGTYYGEFTNGTCTSASRVVVNVTVGVIPAAISLNDVYICGTSTIDDIDVNAATGATVNWYQNIADTTPLANTTVLTTGTYYIAQKIGNCESARTAVNVSTIQNLSMPTATTVQTFCGSGTVGDLMATATTAGANVNWYSYSTSDTPLASNTTLVTGTYYVGQSIGDCDSPKRAVSVRILSVNEPMISAMEICGDATVSSLPLNPAQGISYKVYATPYIATEMGQNDVVTTGIYYISKVENGCETARTAVNVTVNARPNAPTGNINQSFPDYAEVKDLKTNEANVIWFESYNDAVNNVNPLYPSEPLITDKTYYGVLIGTGNCPSLPLAVTVNIFLGLNDLDLASLKYYPNPTDSELTISYKEAIKSIEVYDLAGKQVKSQQFDSDEVKINVSTLAAGTYMVKVHTDTGSQFIKIVKK